MPVAYAHRGLIGTLTPQANTTVEPEMAILLPPGYASIAARMLSPEPSMDSRLSAYIRRLPDWTAQFADAPLDVVAFACTGASYLVGAAAEQDLVAAATARCGVPVVTAGQAVVAALAALSARRVAFVSPLPGRPDGGQPRLLGGVRHRSGPGCPGPSRANRRPPDLRAGRRRHPGRSRRSGRHGRLRRRGPAGDRHAQPARHCRHAARRRRPGPVLHAGDRLAQRPRHPSRTAHRRQPAGLGRQPPMGAPVAGTGSPDARHVSLMSDMVTNDCRGFMESCVQCPGLRCRIVNPGGARS